MTSASARLIYAAAIGYLLMHTGIVSDDFADIVQFQGKSFTEGLRPTGNFINVPVGHFTHHIWFHYFHLDNLVVVDLFKIVFTLISFVLISTFFRLFLGPNASLLASFLFVFFPSHDAMPYAYAPSGHLLSIAVYLYAYCVAERDRLWLAFALALVASFMVYGSTPIAVGLFVLCVLKGNLKKGMALIVPNVIYAIYFVYVTMIASIAPSRILESVNVASVVKQFALQVITFADATFGPSMWLKIYYSFFQLSAVSLVVGAVLIGILVKAWNDEDQTPHPHLVICLLVVTICSFAMFSVTGRYPQLAFNLGNRTTFWGSLLLAYLIVLIRGPRYVRIGGLAVIAFAILGISDHWKAWSLKQQAVIQRIATNQAIQDHRDGSEIFVSGNQYSKFGPISHIEFLSEDWVPGSIFALVVGEDIRARTINRRFRYEGGYLVDRKYSTRTRVDGHINVYDSEKDRLLRVDADDINDHLDTLPEDKRHWAMFTDNRAVESIRELAVFLMPRLRNSL